MNLNRKNVFIWAALLIFAAAASRLVLYPFNFSPIIAMALFSGAVIADKKYAFLLPLLAMFLSDVLFEVFNIAPGFWGMGQVVNYALLALITVIGFGIQKPGVLRIAGFSIASSILFYLVSNTGVWAFEGMYTKDLAGLNASLVAGLPFLKNGIVNDLAYCGILFGGYALITHFSSRRAVA